jgi:hypothetical protein
MKKYFILTSFIYLIFTNVLVKAQTYDLNFSIDSLAYIGNIEGIKDKKSYAKLITDAVANLFTSYEHQFEYNLYLNYKTKKQKNTDLAIAVVFIDRESGYDTYFESFSYARLQKHLLYAFHLRIYRKDNGIDVWHYTFYREKPLSQNQTVLLSELKSCMSLSFDHKGGVGLGVFPSLRKINIQNNLKYTQSVSIDSFFIAKENLDINLAKKLTRMIENKIILEQKAIRYNYYDNYQQAKPKQANFKLKGYLIFDKTKAQYQLRLVWQKENFGIFHEQIIEIDKIATENKDVTLLTFQMAKINLLVLGFKQ